MCSKTIAKVALFALACLALAASSCMKSKRWTPYENLGDSPARAAILQRSVEETRALNSGCISCHEGSTDPHPSSIAGCVDCHGGDGQALEKEAAHPNQRFPEKWKSAANPESSYALLNEESPEWVRFVNPGDLRAANQACGTCHPNIFLNVSKSLMTHNAHFWGVVSYANGLLPNKHSVLGESYSPEGVPQRVNTVPAPTEEELARSVIPTIVPLPQWEVSQTGNVFRVFEKGSRLGGPALGLNGLPIPVVGLPDKLEDPGRPNNRLSDRGLGTLNRIDPPLINLFKTRLNDPHLWFMGTNEQAGDYRSSGCTACHMVYANDRNPIHSGPYARFGHEGQGPSDTDAWGQPVDADPTLLPNDPGAALESGHPIAHKFTRAIPSSQCMVCHMHQPNSFVNSYYGYTMWAYETDGKDMWPKEQAYPSDDEQRRRQLRNPERAAVRGLWGDPDFLSKVSELNSGLEHTQFADYHGHGWVFRAVYKMDRKGNLLDSDGNPVDYDDPTKFQGTTPAADARPPFEQAPGQAVHLRDIHAEKGMHCVDCHFEQDVHGDGKLYAEYQAAIEITCEDCHGTVDEYAGLVTSGPAAGGGHNSASRGVETPWGQQRFERSGDQVIQRSMLYPDVTWNVTQIKDTVTEGHPEYNPRADLAKTQRSSRHGGYAHDPESMECYACHSSWVPTCFGCHLPQEANWKTPTRHFEERDLRNYATYNPQAVRDAEFMLGVAGNVKSNKIAPVRSSSAVLISSKDALRQKIYTQIPTIAANGMSSQAFNTHYPHTVRKTETRACDDCHLSAEGDNNAWLAQAFLLGTGQLNFMGYRAYVGQGSRGFDAVRVTEWEEPQAVIGSNLHRMAYPDDYAAHVERGRKLKDAEHHSGKDVRSLQLRGEYLYVASGKGGLRVYDVANVNNKGFSEKIVTAPVSPLGQDTHVKTKFATAVALPTNNHITMSREWHPENKETPYEYRGRKQNLHESYRYAYVTDRHEGLILVDVDCLSDFDPENNFLKRALTFNPDGRLNGATNLAVAGTTVYICCDEGVVAIDIDDPLEPRIIASVGTPHVEAPTSIAVQFRYAFVTHSTGVSVLDVTSPGAMHPVPDARVEIADARHIYVAKTYGYVSAGAEGLVVLDLEKPEKPHVDQRFNSEGSIDDLHQVQVATTNDSVYAYLADGKNGLRVLQLITPENGGRSAYGFSPRPIPELIATFATRGPAVAISRALDRDRAVDESGHQMAVFGRIGGRPLNFEEMRRFYLLESGSPYTVPSNR